MNFLLKLFEQMLNTSQVLFNTLIDTHTTTTTTHHKVWFRIVSKIQETK